VLIQPAEIAGVWRTFNQQKFGPLTGSNRPEGTVTYQFVSAAISTFAYQAKISALKPHSFLQNLASQEQEIARPVSTTLLR
jgi:hypothetical protein